MRWKPDLRDIRPRRGFLWTQKLIDGQVRWLERAAWVEQWDGVEYLPITWLDEPFETWLDRRSKAGEKERDELVSTLLNGIAIAERGPSTVLGPLCVCGASPCIFRFGTDLCPHDRIVSEFDGTRGTASWACHGCGLHGNGPSPFYRAQHPEP